MTAIVFHQGNLLGDRKHVQITTPVTFCDGPKVFTSKDKTFAYGISGKTITEGQRDKYEKAIRNLIEKMIMSGLDRANLGNLEKKLDSNMDLTSGIFATRDNQYYIHDIGVVYIMRLDGSTHSCGTGGRYIASMLRSGLSIKDSYAKVGYLDNLTGDVCDVIDTKRLKPFVIKGER